MTEPRGASLAEIEAVYRETAHQFRGVAAAIVRDREAAWDLVQEAFALAVRRRASFRGDGPLEAWLWRTVVRAALSHVRRSSRAAVGRPRPAPATTVEEPERHGDLQQAIAGLPERQRLALFLRYYADLDYHTIGDVLGVKDATARASVHAAHGALRRRLELVL
jgi:RNA polymerase sigma-70 factor (ECF subfamily)